MKTAHPEGSSWHLAGQRIDQTFGAENADWHWQDGGSVELEAGEHELRLHDLTGFDGRCDAIPPHGRSIAGPPTTPATCCPLGVGRCWVSRRSRRRKTTIWSWSAAVTRGWARRCRRRVWGLRVALIQNRPVLGGNGSSEVRVWANGTFPDRLYPVGDIIREFSYKPGASPWRNSDAPRGDELAQAVIDAEDNIDLFLLHHGFGVTMSDEVQTDGARRIASVDALDCRTGAIRRFRAPLFVDATGHGFVGMWAGADLTMEEGERMGMSNMWTWALTDSPPDIPRDALGVGPGRGRLPLPAAIPRPVVLGERVRQASDRRPGADPRLEPVRCVRRVERDQEQRRVRRQRGRDRAPQCADDLVGVRRRDARDAGRILGDVILTQEDITSHREWDDAAVLSTWSIDLHYPNRRYMRGFEDNPFISYADFSRAPDNRERGVRSPLPLLLLAQRREPLHRRPVHQCDA